mgnify:CR=1 FL=1
MNFLAARGEGAVLRRKVPPAPLLHCPAASRIMVDVLLCPPAGQTMDQKNV